MMDLIGTIRHEYFYNQEKFGNDDLYCVYRVVIYPAEYGVFSYQEWVETFYDERDAKALVDSKNKNGQ